MMFHMTLKRAMYGFCLVSLMGVVSGAASQIEKVRAKAETMTAWNMNQKVQIEVRRHEGVRVDAKCALRPATCQALEAFRKRAKTVASGAPAATGEADGLAGHPANQRCLASGGTPRVLTDGRLNQWNFCRFADQTMIDSWALIGEGR